jgi:hypothetical protein
MMMLPSIHCTVSCFFVLNLIDFRSSPDSSAMKSDYHGRDFHEDHDACHLNPSQRQDIDANNGFPDSPARPSQLEVKEISVMDLPSRTLTDGTTPHDDQMSDWSSP